MSVAAREPYRLTVAEYSAIDSDTRTELIGGLVYAMAARNEPHRYAVRTLNEFLVPALAPTLIVQVQDAVAVSGWTGHDAPEVDFAILRRRDFSPIPVAADAELFVEVADTTYRYDRTIKMPLYVGAGVSSAIVNIPARRIELYASAADLALPNGRILGLDETVDFCGVIVPVARLFAGF